MSTRAAIEVRERSGEPRVCDGEKEPAAAELQLRSSASGPQVRSLPSELVAERVELGDVIHNMLRAAESERRVSGARLIEAAGCEAA